MRTTQLAINSITTRHQDLPEALDAYGAAGFGNVELVFAEIRDWLDGREVDAFAQLLADRELHLIGGLEAHLVCFGSPERQRANLDLHEANARLLHTVGGGVLTVGTDGPEAPRADALDVIADTLRQLAERIDGLDVTLALEFNWSPLVRSLASAVQVCEKVNHPRVGVLFDAAHYYTTVTKTEDITGERVRWIRHVHLDDMRDKPADLSNCNTDRVLPGEGILDLPGLIGRLERGGYRGCYAVELFNQQLWELPAAETARRCYLAAASLCEAS